MSYLHKTEFTKKSGERMWHRRGAIWRCLAAHPQGLNPAAIAHATGISYDAVYHDLIRMPGVRNAGPEGDVVYYATGVTDEWIALLR